MPRRRYRIDFYKGRISEETRASISGRRWRDHIFVHAVDTVHARGNWQALASKQGLIIRVTPAAK
jgi:hypothetical protein